MRPLFLLFRALLLRRHAVDVAGEHRALLHVVNAQEASLDTLQSDGETAVRRHAVLEGIEVETEVVGIHTALQHLLAIVRLLVDTLPAGGNLQSAHQQVETQRQCGAFGVVHRVESTMLTGEMGYKHKVRTKLLRLRTA